MASFLGLRLSSFSKKKKKKLDCVQIHRVTERDESTCGGRAFTQRLQLTSVDSIAHRIEFLYLDELLGANSSIFLVKIPSQSRTQKIVFALWWELTLPVGESRARICVMAGCGIKGIGLFDSPNAYHSIVSNSGQRPSSTATAYILRRKVPRNMSL